MDELYFYGSFTAAVSFNAALPGGVHPRTCPHDHEGVFLAFIVFLLSCIFLIALGFKLVLEREAKLIEMAPNLHADFLERIDFVGEIPRELMCPITQCIMHDPVRILGGHESHVFERTALEKWINEGRNMNPLNRESLSWWTRLVSANDVAEKIQAWLDDLRLRRRVFSIWSRGKIAEEKCKSDVICLPVSH